MPPFYLCKNFFLISRKFPLSSEIISCMHFFRQLNLTSFYMIRVCFCPDLMIGFKLKLIEVLVLASPAGFR